MPNRTERVNELLKSELAHIINREIFIDGALITISFVDCSSDLCQAKIGISVLPENLSGTALKALNRHSKAFNHILKKKLNLKYIPMFRWIIDGREKHAAEIEKVLNELNNKNN